MNFGQALDEMMQGHKVARKGWNGKGMFVEVRQHPYTIDTGDSLSTSHRFIHIKGADGFYVPWAPSQTDMFTADWEIIE